MSRTDKIDRLRGDPVADLEQYLAQMAWREHEAVDADTLAALRAEIEERVQRPEDVEPLRVELKDRLVQMDSRFWTDSAI